MLGKALKYEFKSTLRIFLPLYAALIVVAGLSRLSKLLLPNLNIFSGITIAICIFIIIGTVVLTFVIMIQRFYKCLLGEEGYLTLTLPVKVHTHILTKGITSVVWIIGTVVAALISIFILIDDYSFLKNLPETLDIINREFKAVFNMSFAFALVLFAIFILIALITQILMIYTAMSVGQLANKNRVVLSFAAYIVLYMAVQFIAMVPITLLMVNQFSALFFDSNMSIINAYTPSPIEMKNLILSIFSITAGINLLLSGIYFFATRYILKNKLNLE